MEKIDFVIAWVDGADPIHQAKRAKYSGQTELTDAMQSTRFASDDEVYFCIASILKYAPYCGKIYLITDTQRPQFLDLFEKEGICEANQIQIIDHQILFKDYEENLPTFNSLSIETMLWRIPSLSENFIYLNDDFFFNSASVITDFLSNQKLKIYGHWKKIAIIKAKFNYRLMLKKCFGKAIQPKYTFAQMLSADIVGLEKYFEVHHRPHMMNRPLLAHFFQIRQQLLLDQIQYRFRDAQQFLPVGLSNHLAIQSGMANLEKDVEIAYLKNTAGVELFLQQINDQTIKFGCIQSLDEIEHNAAYQVKSAMTSKFKDFLPSSLIELRMNK